MRSFGSAIVLVAAILRPASAQLAAARSGTPDSARPAKTVPVALQRVAIAEVARQWAADSTAITLVWGHVPEAASFADQPDVKLIGRGDGGWFVAMFTAKGHGPFAVRVRAGARDSTLTAVRTVDSGRPLASEDMKYVPTTRWGPPPDRSRPVVAAGWLARHTILSGSELDESVASPPPLVRVGDQVRVEWQRGAVRVTLDGTALDAGGLGQAIRIRINQNRGEKSGIVLATGLVRLDS